MTNFCEMSCPFAVPSADDGRLGSGAFRSHMDRSRERYESLDALRGVAAGGIVWLHITSVCRIFSVPPIAFLTVDVFFCLSGFIVAHAYGRATRDIPSALNVLRLR